MYRITYKIIYKNGFQREFVPSHTRTLSYAIIRNEKYTKDEMVQLAPHNERMKKQYSNKNIDLSRTSQNYHLKRPIENTYLKEYIRLVSKNGLNQGQVYLLVK